MREATLARARNRHTIGLTKIRRVLRQDTQDNVNKDPDSRPELEQGVRTWWKKGFAESQVSPSLGTHKHGSLPLSRALPKPSVPMARITQ